MGANRLSARLTLGDTGGAGFMERRSDRWRKGLVAQATPILLAMLIVALANHIALADSSWVGFVWQAGHAAALLAPSLAAHLAASRMQPWPAALVWISGFILYPAVFTLTASGVTLHVGQWALAAGFSLSFLLLHTGARAGRQQQTGFSPQILRLPITLDGTIATLLLLWVLGATSLFASSEDAVRNQPLRVWMNWRRIASEPGETIWYLVQFAALAAILFGWYWICRYVLVRGVLRHQGMVPFAFSVAGFVALGTPLAASVGLLMPLNISEWTIIPSDNHNPFDPVNYRFTFWLTAIVLPLVLTVERLLAEQAEASNRHKRVRAELYMLQQQINPHFLFNTLNTLYALCLRDQVQSAAAVIKLSDLLRYTVYRGQADHSSVEEEIAYLKNYLDLQMLRFGHRCALHTEWPNDGTNLRMPPLLLIMLVENAFKHGVEPVEGGCEVRIAMTIEGQRLRFDCVNSLPEELVTREPGLGLANFRRRLELLLGENSTLVIDDSQGLWRARLEMDLEPC